MSLKNSVSELERLESELALKQAEILSIKEKANKSEVEVEDLKKRLKELEDKKEKNA